MTEVSPPARPGAFGVAGRALGTAARGTAGAFGALVAVCLFLAALGLAFVGVYGPWSWTKFGLLAASLSLRAEAIGSLEPLPGPLPQEAAIDLGWRFVPMALTLLFLWLAARAGRRGADREPGRSTVAVVGAAALGAAAAAALLSAVSASLVTLSFPTLGPDVVAGTGLVIRVDPARAAAWSALLAASAAGVGAFLARHRGSAGAAVRGGLAGYGAALGLLVAGIVVIATFEPRVTGSYLRGLARLGAGGGVVGTVHALALPTQSALLLVPAAGSCLELTAGTDLLAGPDEPEHVALRLCPWTLTPDRLGELLLPAGPVPLAAAFWSLHAVPIVSAVIAGRLGGAGTRGRTAVARGMASGLVFALLGVIGAFLAAPRVSLPVLVSWASIAVVPRVPATPASLVVWGVAGGAIGGWIAARRYEDPELPSPTST